MKKNTQILQESIRAEAYLLSEKAGHPPDLAEVFWLEAEALVLGKTAASNGQDFSPKNGGRKAVTKKKAKNGQLQSSEKKARAGRVSAVH